MFYIESNGFAATTWLAKLLNTFDYLKCAHGSRNFELNTPLGSAADLSEDDFIKQLQGFATHSGQICGAIHGKYSPQFREKIIAQGGHYFLAVRHPITRIFSCHSWMQKQIEQQRLVNFQPAIAGCLAAIPTQQFDFADILFAAAVYHVVDFDYVYISHMIQQQAAFEILQMEHYTANEEYCQEIIRIVSDGRFTGCDHPLTSQQQLNVHNPDKLDIDSLSPNQQAVLESVLSKSEIKTIYNALGYQY